MLMRFTACLCPDGKRLQRIAEAFGVCEERRIEEDVKRNEDDKRQPKICIETRRATHLIDDGTQTVRFPVSFRSWRDAGGAEQPHVSPRQNNGDEQNSRRDHRRLFRRKKKRSRSSTRD